MAGQKADNLDERIGNYGEQLVLLAQALGPVSYTHLKLSSTYLAWFSFKSFFIFMSLLYI